MRKKIIIHHNPGIGDHIICNGLVNNISEEKHVTLICSLVNYKSIKYLYSENDFVRVLPVPSLKKINYYLNAYFFKTNKNIEKLFSKIISIFLFLEIRYIGFENISYPEWDKAFYKISNIDFNTRFNNLKLPIRPPEEIDLDLNKEFILIQNTSSKSSEKFSLNIDSKLQKIFLDSKLTPNFFSNIHLIRKAKEIHCIDSSLIHLVEAIDSLNCKLYFHDIRKHYKESVFSAKKNWQIVKYEDLVTWGSGIKLI
tara:strand:- start:1413 stop:2174 length:762 start_codon:yes stop_codon:yes gene_type:complete